MLRRREFLAVLERMTEAHGDRVSGFILSGSPGLPEPAVTRRPSRDCVRQTMEETVFRLHAVMATPVSATPQPFQRC